MVRLSDVVDTENRRSHASHQVTALLRAWTAGESQALDELMPLVTRELRRQARRYMAGERRNHTLQPTALINEAYVRLVDLRQMRWQDRAHFFAMSARLMRRILVDYARARGYGKRGGGAQMVTLSDTLDVHDAAPPDIVALNDALNAFARIDERKAQVVELRYFGGLTVEETAHALRVSPETVMRDWKVAKLWLLHELKRSH
ncbi:MAG TPA: sigma-70 family RNA polymerase sigma factor [Vicinamibacterales bacterium]|jgi:RNA polymerase sigma factor (TIGR02999 family)